MDSLSQAALGAAIGEAVLGRRIGWKGAAVGALFGTIPDLDVLLVPFFSEFQKISLHRGYSHSILFCLAIGIIGAYILSRLNWTKSLSYVRLWIFAFLALFTHVMLDAFTSYGTQLFLPFTDLRVSYDSIGIIDPFYTIPLLIGLLISLFKFNREDRLRYLPNAIGLFLSSLYLVFTLINKHQIESIFTAQLEAQDISMEDLLTVPVKIGNVEWYGVAKAEDRLHIGKYSKFKKNAIEFHSFPINDHLLDELDEVLVKKLKWFAQDFYTVAEKDGKIRMYNMQCDMQGVREYGNYRAPTAFYYEITPLENRKYYLTSGMHPKIDN